MKGDTRRGERAMSHVVVWDEDCSVCERVIRYLTPRTASGIVFLGAGVANTPEWSRLGLTREQVLESMWLVNEDTLEREAGYWAFKAIVLRSHSLQAWAILFRLPGSDFVGPWLYRQFARRRRHLGCAAETCVIPSLGQPPGEGSQHRDL